MSFFTNASKRGRVRYGDLPGSIDIVDSLDTLIAVGVAVEVGISLRGYVIWSLEVNGAKLPGRFMIVDGEFVRIDSDLG
jgi:hypothetical protein